MIFANLSIKPPLSITQISDYMMRKIPNKELNISQHFCFVLVFPSSTSKIWYLN
jgi:hypothetical protein